MPHVVISFESTYFATRWCHPNDQPPCVTTLGGPASNPIYLRGRTGFTMALKPLAYPLAIKHGVLENGPFISICTIYR